jgi:hypothetical protein
MEEQKAYGTVVVPNHYFEGEEIVVTLVEGGFFKAKGLSGLYTTRKKAEQAIVDIRKRQMSEALLKEARKKDALFRETRNSRMRGRAKNLKEEAKRCQDKQLQSPYSVVD